MSKDRQQGIIVTRFSPRPNAEDCTSCATQAERCLQYCEKNEIEFVHCWNDEGVSGAAESRPGLDAAIEALKPGMVLVADRHDRLARDMHVSLAIRLRVAMAGATIAYADGTPSDSTPVGEFMVNVLAAVAQYQRSQIKDWCKKASKKKRKERKVFGTVPIGWEKREVEGTKELVRCESERRAIIEVFAVRATERLAIRCYSSSELANIITRRVGPCRGKPWSARTVRRIIKREAYWACPVNGDMSKEPTHP